MSLMLVNAAAGSGWFWSETHWSTGGCGRGRTGPEPGPGPGSSSGRPELPSATAAAPPASAPRAVETEQGMLGNYPATSHRKEHLQFNDLNAKITKLNTIQFFNLKCLVIFVFKSVLKIKYKNWFKCYFWLAASEIHEATLLFKQEMKKFVTRKKPKEATLLQKAVRTVGLKLNLIWLIENITHFLIIKTVDHDEKLHYLIIKLLLLY